MRKVAVKCAAANDDEDDFGSFLEERAPKRPRVSQPSNVGVAPEQPLPTSKKKEKEFAWMDSDNESNADASDEEPKEVDEEVTTERLDKVDSFGPMMLLSESLHRKLKSSAVTPGEVAAACRALARSKFFDGELLEDLSTCILALVGEDKLTAEQVTDVMACSRELNYYRKDVFAAISKTFKTKVTLELNGPMRNMWRDTMLGLGHQGDLDFLQILEVPPLLRFDPRFLKVRCVFFEKGKCQLGTDCTYAHSHTAPQSLSDAAKEDLWRNRTAKGKVLPTHDQEYVFKDREYGSKTGALAGQSSSGHDNGASAVLQRMQGMMQMMQNAMQANSSMWDASGGDGDQGASDAQRVSWMAQNQMA